MKLPRRSDACAVQPEALKDADVKDRIALRSQDLLPSRGSEDLAAALGHGLNSARFLGQMSCQLDLASLGYIIPR